MSKRHSNAKLKAVVSEEEKHLLQEDYNSKKTIHLNDIRVIHPLNDPQTKMKNAYEEGYNMVLDGSAGTGKTYYAMYLGIIDILNKDTPREKIIIVRSAVASRDIGHLPGTQEEKMEVYETPYRDILADITGKATSYDKFKRFKQIQFMPTSFVRGLTWDNSVIIIDEVQNLNFHELNSILTRVGENSLVIVIGDKIQTDLYKSAKDTCGMERFIKVASRMEEFGIIDFSKDDIIRSGFVKSWINALEGC